MRPSPPRDRSYRNRYCAKSLQMLAHIAVASRAIFPRLFNEHAGMIVIAYVNRMRVALARELLTSSRLDIETVAERAGLWVRPAIAPGVESSFHEMPASQMRDARSPAMTDIERIFASLVTIRRMLSVLRVMCSSSFRRADEASRAVKD